MTAPHRSAACRPRTECSQQPDRRGRTPPLYAPPVCAGTRRTSPSTPLRGPSPFESTRRRGRTGMLACYPSGRSPLPLHTIRRPSPPDPHPRWPLSAVALPNVSPSLYARRASRTRRSRSTRLTTATSRLRNTTPKNPTTVVLLMLAKVSHRACSTTAVRKAPPTRQFNVACPTLSLSLHRTAHTSPVHDICPAGELRPRTKSTSSRTSRLPREESKETNP